MRVGSRESSLPPGEGCRCASPPHFRFRNKVIPAHFSRTHTAPRPVHPRALREASLSGTGERWPRTGATRTPKARRLKLHRPGATDGVTGLFGGSAVTPCQTARRCPGPKRWLETSATGGLAEQSLKHRARDAGEKADLLVFSGISRGSVGPRGVPRALEPFSSAHRPNDSDAKRIARTMETV